MTLRLLGLLALGAPSFLAAGSPADPPTRVPCIYVAAPTGRSPHPELQPHADCAELSADGSPTIAPEHLAAVGAEDGLAAVLIEGQWFWVDPDDGRALPVITWNNGPDPWSEGLVRSRRQNGKIAFYDRELRQAVTPRWDFAWPFEDGRALVCLGCRPEPDPSGEHTSMIGGRWGFIDRRGKEVVPVVLTREEALMRSRASISFSRPRPPEALPGFS